VIIDVPQTPPIITPIPPLPLPLPVPHQPKDVVAPTDLSEETKEKYNQLVALLRLKLQRPFTAPKIIMLVAEGVRFMSHCKKISNPEKKDLVLHAIREVIQNSGYIEEDEKEQIIAFVDLIGDETIEKLVEFGRDVITFIKKKTKGCLSCCGPIRVEPQVTSHERSLNLGNEPNLPEYGNLRRYIKLKLQKPITAPKVIALIAAGVRFMEHYKNMSGSEKKDVVLRVIRDVIQESDKLTDEEKTELIGVLDIFGDSMIEYLVQFGKDTVMFLKKKFRLLPCFKKVA